MDEYLKQQFFQQKLDDIRNDNLKLLPTIICERERPEILELVRQYCLYSNRLVPYLVKYHPKIVSEGLDYKRGDTQYGDLYIEVFTN
jgi:hypothetical protein